MPESRHTPPRHAALRVRRCGHGFSLIELVLVTVIVGIVAAMAVPRYADALSRYQIDAAAQRVVADIDYARHHAKAKSTDVTIFFSTANDSLAVPALPSLTQPDAPHTTDLTEAPYRVVLTAANFSGNARLMFDGYGKPVSGGTVILRAGSRARVITIDATTGEASIQ